MEERFKNFNLEKDLEFLRIANEGSKRAAIEGFLPFGAIIVDGEGNIIVDEICRIQDDRSDATAHAETTCVRVASQKYDSSFLWDCTLYSPFEPCAMCTGAVYWGNIGRIVFGLSEGSLKEQGASAKNDNEDNGYTGQTETFNIPCQDILAGGQKDVVVNGPIVPEGSELEKDFVAVMTDCWNK